MGVETDWSLLFALPHAVCGIPVPTTIFGLLRYEVGLCSSVGFSEEPARFGVLPLV